jgi:hypothetical protein
MPITMLAARLPFAAIGAAVLQIFHLDTGRTIPTRDAGYVTAGEIPFANSRSVLRAGRPYMNC